MLEDATPDTFQPHVGTVFTAEVEGMDPLELTLVEVRLDKTYPGQVREQPFTLLFKGRTDVLMHQRTWDFRHEALGEVSIFIVPTGPGAYEAVFN